MMITLGHRFGEAGNQLITLSGSSAPGVDQSAAVDAAVNNDLVLVADGTYTGVENRDIDFGGKSITVRSNNGPENCVIDCEGLGRGFYFHSSETRAAVLQGFTITGGLGSNYGGGIYCLSSNPTIFECVITGNSAVWGGGIFVDGNDTTPLVDSCVITWNTATRGGGIGMDYTSHTSSHHTEVVSCLIAWNETTQYGGGIYVDEFQEPVVYNCLILENTADWSGGGLCAWEADPVIRNCTVLGNTSDGGDGGGGIYAHGFYGSYVSIANSIVRGNTPDQMEYQVGSLVSAHYCDVEGGFIGTEILDQDPLFVTGPDGDYYLDSGSPCIDTGGEMATVDCFTSISGTVCMDELTTQLSRICDAGVVDMGYHYSGISTVSCSLSSELAEGTLPFNTMFTVTLANDYDALTRRMAANLLVILADGRTIDPWRRGFTNIGPLGSYTTTWIQNFPAIGSLVGNNYFQLETMDVTPSPYNQPPYLPSGDTDRDSTLVTGLSP